MIYAYDEPVQLPVKDLYDTQIMAMAINAAKDMYEKGQQEMKDFAKAYGDFYTPIAKDLDWFNLNVTGRLRSVLDEIYRQGGNPLTNPLARMYIQRAINSMPYGDIAKVKLSAENAREFLKAKQRLWLEGKYNPMYDPFDGPSLSDYATVGEGGLGIWERLSPTPIQNMAEFSKVYFDNIKPFKTAVSKNGVSYTKAEINMDDLRRIARLHHNDLINTPQGQLMYKYYKSLYDTDEDARNAFDEAVVSGNIDRLYYEDDYNDNWIKRQELRLRQEDNDLDREKFNWEKYKYQQEQEEKQRQAANPSNTDKGRNYYQDLFDRGILAQAYGEAGSPPLTKEQIRRNSNAVLKSTEKAVVNLANIPSYSDSRWVPTRDQYLAANVRTGIIDPAVLTRSLGRPVDNGKTDCVFVSPGDIDRFHSDDDVVSHTYSARGHKHFLRTTNGELSEYKPNGKKESRLKMQFSDLTYTAPTVDKNNNVRMVLYQKVHLYDHGGGENSADVYLGDKWYVLYESDPTPGVRKGNKILYKTVSTTISENNSGYMLPWASEAEHVLHSTSEGKYNPLVRN